MKKIVLLWYSKEVFGIGILDFIHSQRLLHAKELLKDPANQIDMI